MEEEITVTVNEQDNCMNSRSAKQSAKSGADEKGTGAATSVICQKKGGTASGGAANTGDSTSSPPPIANLTFNKLERELKVSESTRTQRHRVSTRGNQTTPWDDVQLDLVLEGRLTVDYRRKEDWIQKEIARKLDPESNHTPFGCAVTPKDDSVVVDGTPGIVAPTRREYPPEVPDLPTTIALSPRGTLKFKSSTVQDAQVKERESNCAHSADAEGRSQAQRPGLEDQSQHGPPCDSPQATVSGDESNYAPPPVQADWMIEWPIPDPSLPSNYSKMV